MDIHKYKKRLDSALEKIKNSDVCKENKTAITDFTNYLFVKGIGIARIEHYIHCMRTEQRMLKEMVDKVVNSGANVLICQKGIDDVAQHYLAKKKILACRRAKKSDMEALAKSTGGRIVTNLDDLSPVSHHTRI